MDGRHDVFLTLCVLWPSDVFKRREGTQTVSGGGEQEKGPEEVSWASYTT